MSTVRVVDVFNVAVPAAGVPPPEDGNIKLNALEAQWVVFPVLQYIVFFEEGDGQQLPAFDAAVQSLRSSLAATLATHAPLAGKLDYLADTGDVAIRCAASDSVRFVVAESEADVRRLAGDEEHNVLTFERLVPEIHMMELPTPVLAVQATRLGGGGLALGVTVHHGVADGRSLWRFMEAWAAACRGDAPPVPPVFDRSRVRLPGGEELTRRMIRKYAPNLPAAFQPPSGLVEDRMRFTRRTFTLDAQQIQRLKERVVHVGQAHGAPLRRPPSSFVAVIALAWTSLVRCRFAPTDEEDVFLLFFADVRDRLDPPAGAEYFGSCVTACQARLPARELHGERALAAAASAAQRAVQAVADDPTAAAGLEFMAVPEVIPMHRMLNVSGSSSFRAFEAADFGWGRPRRVEAVRMNHDGQVDLARARDGEGVRVSVSMLSRAHIDTFSSGFLQLLG